MRPSKGSSCWRRGRRAVEGLQGACEQGRPLDLPERNYLLYLCSPNVANYYGEMTQRKLAVELADYPAKRKAVVPFML